jgi:hypothetical protein
MERITVNGYRLEIPDGVVFCGGFSSAGYFFIEFSKELGEKVIARLRVGKGEPPLFVDYDPNLKNTLEEIKVNGKVPAFKRLGTSLERR